MMFLLIVTIASMAIAAVMSLVAWRIAAEDRRRSDTRVAALAADIHAHPAQRWADEVPLRPASIDAYRETAAVAGGEEGRAPGSRLRSALIACSLVLAGVGAAIIVSRQPSGHAATSPALAPAPPSDRGQTQALPALELTALGHERDGERLIVRGVARNPSTQQVDGVAAVVFAFSADGNFVASGRAPIDGGVRPGGESPFVVSVPAAAAAARYRVSFRIGDQLVPHVDRRESSRP